MLMGTMAKRVSDVSSSIVWPVLRRSTNVFCSLSVWPRQLCGPQSQPRGAPQLRQRAEVPVDVESGMPIQQAGGEGIDIVIDPAPVVRCAIQERWHSGRFRRCLQSGGSEGFFTLQIGLLGVDKLNNTRGVAGSLRVDRDERG